MGIPDHLTCLLRNLYAGQEATVRTGHGTTDWFQIGKGVSQGCISHPAYLTSMQSTSGEGNGTSLQYSCLENPIDGGAWWAAVHGVAKSRRRRRNRWATSLSLSRIGEGNGNPLQCFCLENPRDGRACWAAIYGVAQSRTWLKRLSSSSRRVHHEKRWAGRNTSWTQEFWEKYQTKAQVQTASQLNSTKNLEKS